MSQLTKVIGTFGFVFLLSIVFHSNVNAAAMEEQLQAPPTDGTLSLSPNEGAGIIEINPVNILANNYFLNGKSFISATGNSVTLSGNTRAYSTVDTLTLNLYLQRWDATRQTWITIVSFGPFTKNNATLVTGSQKVTVASKYYYRLRAHHRVSHNGTIEQAYSNTSSIYIK